VTFDRFYSFCSPKNMRINGTSELLFIEIEIDHLVPNDDG
jgi:hypothetical protein